MSSPKKDDSRTLRVATHLKGSLDALPFLGVLVGQLAIRALSPAVNDPTTAVQVLDYVEDLLLVIGRYELHGRDELHDGEGGSGS